MKLRAQLLLSGAILLILMVGVLYILPKHLIEKDILTAIGEARTLLLAERKELVASQEAWLVQELNHKKDEIDGILLLHLENTQIETLQDNPELEFIYLKNPKHQEGMIIHNKKESLEIPDSFLDKFKAKKLSLDSSALLFYYKDQIYLGNTLLSGTDDLTIASSLNPLLKTLAMSMRETSLMSLDGQYWVGFDKHGNPLPSTFIESFKEMGEKAHGTSSFDILGEPYFYSSFQTTNAPGMKIYNLIPLKEEQSLMHAILRLQNKITEKISLQLFLVSLLLMGMLLIFIWKIGVQMIRPITHLAEEARIVASGKYEEVTFPDVGHRKDEVATLTHAFEGMVTGLKDREKIRGVLNKVVSKEIADVILKSNIQLGGEDRVATMLFSDIRGFTHLSENLSPQMIIKMLNACMTKVTRVIEGEGGVIDKYVGDEVMALFGAPILHPDHGLRAVSAGLLIIETLKQWNQERKQEGLPAIEMGIGVHTGLVVAGNMGAEDRLNYTVLGANVNLAARLCDIAAPNQLLVSKQTLDEPNILQSFYYTPLQPIQLKGFSEAIPIFEIKGFKWEQE